MAVMAELLPPLPQPPPLGALLGDVWLSGGTVAVLRLSLDPAGLSIVSGGGLDPGGRPEKEERTHGLD